MNLLRCLNLFFFSLISFWLEKAYADECYTAIGQINNKELDLYGTTKNLLNAFNETCYEQNTCFSDIRQSESVITKTFTSLIGSSLDPMSSACKIMGSDYELCYVTTEYKSGGLVNREVNKPVCFPPSCTETDVDALDDVCDSSSECEITARSVLCPERNINTGRSCNSDARSLSFNRRLKRFNSKLQQSTMMECINVILGEISEMCDVSSYIKVTNYKDFRGYESNLNYLSFEDKCAEYGAKNCKASFISSGILDSPGTFFKFDTNVFYTEHPFCLPLECSDDSPYIFAKEILFDSGFNCYENNCDIQVTSFSCE